MYDHVVLHYGEIGTKAGNRAFFEKALARNVARIVRPWGAVEPRRESGRIAFPSRRTTTCSPPSRARRASSG